MKHELGLILKKYEGKQADFSQLRAMFHDINLLHESLPDFVAESCYGSVSISDFKYAKMQTVHQLLVNTVSRPTETTEKAIELARMVDAAFGAIDSQLASPTASPAGDIDLEAADFSDALMWLKEGKPVCRSGWNGKDQYVILIPGEHLARSAGYGFGEAIGEFAFGSVLALKNSQDIMQPGWVPSQGDLFATDWRVAR